MKGNIIANIQDRVFSLVETFILSWALSLPEPYLVNQARQAEFPCGLSLRVPCECCVCSWWWDALSIPCSVCWQRNTPQWLLRDSGLHSETQLLKKVQHLEQNHHFLNSQSVFEIRAIMEFTLSPLHTKLQVVNFQKCWCAFYQDQVWVTLQLALHLLSLTLPSSASSPSFSQ